MRKPLLFIFSVLHMFIALAQPGSPDSTFGTNGSIKAPIIHIATAPDGKIVTTGNANNTNTISRYNTDGSLDLTFGNGGTIIQAFTNPVDVKVQADGYIVIAGTVNGDFGVARYTSDGIADHSFGTNGTVTTNIDIFLESGIEEKTEDAVTSFDVGRDGTLVVAGNFYNGADYNWAEVHYYPHGDVYRIVKHTEDPFHFTVNPVVSVNSTGSSVISVFDGATSILVQLSSGTHTLLNYPGMSSSRNIGNKIQRDNKAVVFGYSDSLIDPATGFSETFSFMARLNPDGSLDKTFGGDGYVRLPLFLKAEIAYQQFAIQADGKIIVSGQRIASNGGTVDYAVARFNADGSLDEGFGKAGIAKAVSAIDLAITNNRIFLTEFGTLAAYQLEGVKEICGNGIDDDDDGLLDEDCNTIIWYRDADRDGFGNPAQTKMSRTQPPYYVANNLDCNDKNKTKGGPEICDGIDNDCDGIIDNGFDRKPFYSDFDGDGYGTPKRMVMACAAPPRFVANSDDCNDDNKNVYPGAPELCDGRDNNCNGVIDEGFEKVTFYHDFDKDGYGNSGVTIKACAAPLNYVAVAGDCNDRNAAIHPGAVGRPNDGIDNNCNGLIDEPLHSIAKGQEVTGEQIVTLQLSASPNPASQYFTLRIQSASNKNVSLRIVDGVGRVVEIRQGIASNATVAVGHNYKAGIYFAEAMQDGERVTIKLVKQAP